MEGPVLNLGADISDSSMLPLRSLHFRFIALFQHQRASKGARVENRSQIREFSPRVKLRGGLGDMRLCERMNQVEAGSRPLI